MSEENSMPLEGNEAADALFNAANTKGSYLEAFAKEDQSEPEPTADNPEGNLQTEPEKEEHAEKPAEEETKPAEQKPAEKYLKVKVHGEEMELPESEVVKLAQMGEDYRRKTMTLADERKALEAEKQRIEQLKQELANRQPEPTPAPVIQGETAKQEFERVYKEQYQPWDDDHADKMAAIIEQRAMRQAEQNLFKRMQEEQQRRNLNELQPRIAELTQIDATTPPEVIEYAKDAMFALAANKATQNDFNILYSAVAKAYNNPQTLTVQEADMLIKHVKEAAKDYYKGKAKPVKPITEVEEPGTPVPKQQSKSLSAKEISQLDYDGGVAAFGRYLDGLKK